MATASELLAKYVDQQKAIDETATALVEALLSERGLRPGTIAHSGGYGSPLVKIEYAKVSRQGHFPDDVGVMVWAGGINADGSPQSITYGIPLNALRPA